VSEQGFPPDGAATSAGTVPRPVAAGAPPWVRSVLERFPRLADVTAGVDPFPLVVLTALFFIDEFDTSAFAVNAHEIEKAFGLDDKQFGLIVGVNALIILLAAIPLGYYGDRVRRVRLARIGAVIAGAFTLFPGLAPVVALLVAARLGNGAGRLVNGSVHNSLLSDDYPPESRPRVLGFHQNGEFVGAIAGPAIAGLFGSLLGWRATFVLLAIPIVAMVVLARWVEEPRRGQTDDPAAAVEAERDEPIPFRPAVRTLLAVRTLKRQYLAWVFIGAGGVPLAIYLPLFLERAFGLSPFWRGAIGAANAAATFYGVLRAGRWTARWLGAGLGEPLKRAGLSMAVLGLGLLAVAVAPTLWLEIPVGLVASFAFGTFYPPFFATQAFVSPARVRTLSFAFGALFLGAGGVLFLVFLGGLSDDRGIRYGVGATVPFFLIGGAVLRSAHRFVQKDTEQALRSLATEAAQRRQRLDAKDRSLLVCSGLDAGYDAVQILFGVDLEISEGEVVALLGTNGAGKSTLLKSVSGLLDPRGGLVLFDGNDVTHLDPIERAKLGIVQMPGGRSVFPTLTVDECLRLAGWLHKGDPEHVRSATARVRELFPILTRRKDALAGNMSGGEQQMLGLAMALISKPRLLMIDELSLGLAPSIVSQLVGVVRDIHAQGTTIILVEQSVNVALLLAERAVFMEKGEVRFSGATKDLLERDDILRSVFLEGAAAATGSSSRSSTAPARVRPAVPADAPVVLELAAIDVRFGGVKAVDEASFQLRQGEVLGLIGPNGAGKTTIFDAISGFVPLAGGHVRFDGQDITRWTPDRRARAGLGRSFQDARIFPALTVAENIAVSLERHLQVRDPIAAALGLPEVLEAEVAVAWQVHELIELLGLGAFRNKFVAELSTGSRRVVDLAMAIAHQPKVLLLDEPSSGIAQRETEALGPLMLRIKDEVGCSLLVIEHDMPLITGVADRMVALELGHPICEGTPNEVVNHPRVVASYLGTDEQVVNRSGALSDVVPEADLPIADPKSALPPGRRPRSADGRRAPLKARSPR
jgi:branched-chain amino acid transport system ATP-binding protein